MRGKFPANHNNFPTHSEKPRKMGKSARQPPALPAAIAALMEPLVRLLVANGIPLATMVEILKSAYVRVAAKHFRLDEGSPTDTRVALLTGVHRKDVRRLRAQPSDAPPEFQELNELSEVVTRWAADRRYLGRDGRPRALPRHSSPGVVHSFDSLAYGVSSDLKPRTILDELTRLGMARIEDERVVLEVDAFVPEHGSAEAAYFFGENIRDHIAAAARNIEGTSAPFLEQAVYSDDLSRESIDELHGLSRDLWAEFLKEIVRRAGELEEHDRADSRATERMNLGIYFYSEPRAPTTRPKRARASFSKKHRRK